MARFSLRQLLTMMAHLQDGDRQRAVQPTRHRSRLVLESLEGRCVPSTVTNLNNAGPGSLRQAIFDTPSNGTVDFQSGLTGTITLTSGELLIEKVLKIVGPGASVITVSGNHATRVFEVAPTFTVAISGLSIANGQATGNQGGGAIYNGGTMTVTSSTLSSNSPSGFLANGGAIFNAGRMTVTGSTLSDNQPGANGNGGSIYNGGTLTVTGSKLIRNSAINGGGIHNVGTLTVVGSTVSGNLAVNYGGGIYNTAGTVTITGSTLSGNSAITGGGILNGGPLTITASILTGNFAITGFGGGIVNGGPLTITASTLSANSAYVEAGGIYNAGTGTLTVAGSTVSGNLASHGGGGGIYNPGGMVTITSSTLSGNSCGNNSGGSIANGGTLTVTGSTFSGNSATYGSGIFNHPTASLTVTDSTFSGNSGTFGVGIYNNGELTVTGSTFSGNSASFIAGGIYQDPHFDLPIVRNTMLAGNTAPSSPDLSGPVDSRGHNLIGNGTGGSGYTDTDLVGTAENPIDPRLGPLQDNGGPTRTMALLPGSPAVDAGDNTDAPDFDQRGQGFDRIVGGTIDIGAVEAQIGSATSFRIDAPGSVLPGMPFDITVTALDAYNHVATGYTGTVTFTTTDLDKGVVLPADYTFTAEEGVHKFTDTGRGETTLITPGDQTIIATDTKDDSITGNAIVTVTGGNGPRMVRGNFYGGDFNWMSRALGSPSWSAL